MDWQECKNKNLVKNISQDANFAGALISLREVLEALAIKKGFKIYNHECFSCFLPEVCKESAFAAQFDRFRKLQNQINYYGREVSLRNSATLIREIVALRKILLERYF